MAAFLITPILTLLITLVVHVIVRRVHYAALLSLALCFIIGTIIALKIYPVPTWSTFEDSVKWSAISTTVAVAFVSPIALLLRWLVHLLSRKERSVNDSSNSAADRIDSANR